MRKAISTVLAASIALPVILTSVTGCVTAAAEDSITNGELIVLINNSFGFEGYDSQEPYFSGVSSASEYFSDIQTAVEYRVIDELVEDINPEASVTREFFAMSVSGAINSDRTHSQNISDISEITYLDDVLTVLNYGLMELDESGRFNPDEKMGAAECLMLVDEALGVWASCTVSEPTYEVELKEGVIDFTGMELYSYDSSADEMVFDSTSFDKLQDKMSDNNFKCENGVITVDSADEFGIEVGSVLVIPSESGSGMPVKVTEITKNSDGTDTVKTETASAEEVVEKYEVEQAIEPDFTSAEVYDADGNLLSPVSDDETVGLLSATDKKAVIGSGRVEFGENQKSGMQELGASVKMKYEIPIGIGKVNITVGSDSISASVTANLIDEKIGNDKASSSISFAEEFKNISFDYNAKYEPLGDKYCKFVMNYDTVEKMTFKGELKTTKKLVEFKFPTGVGDLCVNVGVNLEVTAEGSVAISLTTNNHAVGFEWRGGTNLSTITRADSPIYDVTGKVKVEVTLPLDVNISACLDIVKAGVALKCGAGAQMFVTKTGIETPDSGITDLICSEVSFYPVVKLEVYVSVLKFKKSAEKEFLGSKDVFYQIHYEEYGDEEAQRVDECTKDKRLNQLKDEETKNAGVTVGETLLLDTNKAEINVGDSLTVKLAQLPSGYTYEDIYVYTNDNTILDAKKENILSKLGLKVGVSLDGYSYTTNALAVGNATLTFKTKDGKYSANCEVTVLDPSKSRDWSVKLSTYGTNTSVGGKTTLEIEEIPEFLTIDQLIWTSSDTNIALVDQSGTVYGVSKGYAIIYAMTPDERSKAACSITVDDNGKTSVRFIPQSEIVEVEV